MVVAIPSADQIVAIENGMYLQRDAARAWNAAKALSNVRAGRVVTVTIPYGALRTMEMQWQMWRDRSTSTTGVVAYPGYSVHGSGLCVDVGNYLRFTRSLLDAIMGACGFYRTISNEPWHYELKKIIPASLLPGYTPILEDELTPAEYNYLLDAIRRSSTPRLMYAVPGTDKSIPFDDSRVTYAALGRSGNVKPLFTRGADRKGWLEAYRANGEGMLMALAEQPDAMTLTEFFAVVDEWDDPQRPFGSFVKNALAVESGPTAMIRQWPDGHVETFPFASRQLVWIDARPVEITKGGKLIVKFSKSGTTAYAHFADGTKTQLTQTEVDRANAQLPSGQVWTA